MQIFREITPLKAFLLEKRQDGQSIGFVPTMGALHPGHLALLQASKNTHDLTVCSIYVNPAQFNNPADLAKYPRDLARDTSLLKEAESDVLFCPENSAMYQDGSSLRFDFGTLDKVMEGQYRPGHFSGVALVVSKLFNIVQPHHAYFGQKDWQQFAIIQQLVSELKFDLQLHCVPTVREPDGLAMSSRNKRLSESMRQEAPVIYQALLETREALKQGRSIPNAKKSAAERIERFGRLKLEYIEVADRDTLKLLTNIHESKSPILCAAVHAGDVRLIDNLFL
jgi:pantoate--beta-alanine ligase